MPRVAAAHFRPQLSSRQIDLIMHDHDRLGQQLEEARRRAHGPATLIHEGRRFEQPGLAPSQHSFGDNPFEAPAPWPELITLMNHIRGHEADIVPVARIGLAGIAEPGDQKGDVAHWKIRYQNSEIRRRKRSGPASDFYEPIPASLLLRGLARSGRSLGAGGQSLAWGA